MENIVIAVIIIAIVGLASLYVYKAKKSGKKCIGCPSGGCCSQNGTCSSCSGHCEDH